MLLLLLFRFVQFTVSSRIHDNRSRPRSCLRFYVCWDPDAMRSRRFRESQQDGGYRTEARGSCSYQQVVVVARPGNFWQSSTCNLVIPSHHFCYDLLVVAFVGVRSTAHRIFPTMRILITTVKRMIPILQILEVSHCWLHLQVT